MATEGSNKLIAKFMGYEYRQGVALGGSWSRFFKIGGVFEESFPYAKYHNSWSWLMPVVEKINLIKEINVEFTIDKYCSGWIVWDKNNTGDLNMNQHYERDTSQPLIDNTYKSVIEFIKWYNCQELSS